MKLLVDECIDERLRLLFPAYDCQTARFANLAGLKNGRLLEAAEAAGFDVLITADQTLLVPAAISAIGSIKAGEVVRIR
jgi:hypothetical protein